MQSDGKTTVKNSTTYSNIKKEKIIDEGEEGTASVKFVIKDRLKRKPSAELDTTNPLLGKFKEENQNELAEQCQKLDTKNTKNNNEDLENKDTC